MVSWNANNFPISDPNISVVNGKLNWMCTIEDSLTLTKSKDEKDGVFLAIQLNSWEGVGWKSEVEKADLIKNTRFKIYALSKYLDPIDVQNPIKDYAEL